MRRARFDSIMEQSFFCHFISHQALVACGISLMVTQKPFVAMAQTLAPSPIPNSVPLSAKPALDERDKLEKKIVPPGSNPKAIEVPRATPQPNETKFFATESTADALDLPAASENKMDGKDALLASPELMPQIEAAPPQGFAAFQGQTLSLSTRISKQNPLVGPSRVAWIFNGKVVCHEANCEIPLDGKTANVGLSSLLVVAYNAYGSSQSQHVVRVISGSWRPGQPFSNRFKKVIDPVAQPLSKPSAANKNQLNAFALRGNGILTYPEHANVIGSVPRNLNWTGYLKTTPAGTVKLTLPGKADWYALGMSDMLLNQSPDDPNQKMVRLIRGGIRMRHQEKTAKSSSYSVTTDEVRVIPAPGADFYISRLLEVNKKTGETGNRKAIATHVVVISGKVILEKLQKEQGKPAEEIELQPGIDFVAFNDGSVAPLRRPDPARMERLIQLTMTQDEIKELAKRKAEAKVSINLPEHMKKVAELFEREDYFEVVSELQLVEDRAAENIQIPYMLGMSYKGVYQLSEAEKNLKIAADQDKGFVLAPWNLAQMAMENKKWDEAQSYLDEAYSRMPADDKLRPSYFYYSGVINFQKESLFGARNRFTEALWENDLDAMLRSSAGNFLQNLGKKKPWTLAIPFGVQYDGNGLGVANGAAVPAPYTRKSLLRSIAGGIYTYDHSIGKETPSTYWGGGAKLIYVKNFPSQFKTLDALVGEATAMQTIVQKVQDKVSAVKITESIGFLSINGKISTQTFSGSVSLTPLDLGLTFERDAINTGAESRNALTAHQGYSLNLLASDSLSADIDLSGDERYVMKRSVSNGHELTLGATPSFTVPIGVRANIKTGCLLSWQYIMRDPGKASALKISPTTTGTYFIAPWLISMLGLSFEYSKNRPENTNVIKPGASLMFTGLF